MTVCPRCGEGAAETQEFCLGCGRRLPGRHGVGPVPIDPRRLLVPLALTAAVAISGAALAIVLTRPASAPVEPIVATGGSLRPPSPALDPRTRLATWPSGQRSGWTNVLLSVPKADGRDSALAQAQRARRRGLPSVGILDSSRYASLHPGYWIVFSGVYASEPEAASALQEAKSVQQTARTQRIER